MTKITPYFKGLTPKIRIMLYLLGTGKYTLDGLRKMSVGDFLALGLADVLPSSFELKDICHELVAGRDANETVFCNQSGRTYSIRDLTEILKRSHKIAGVPYEGLQVFAANVS